MKQVKNILFIGLGVQDGIRNALANYGNVIYLDWTKRGQRYFNEDVVMLFDEHRPELVFMQIQTPNIIKPKIADYMAKNSFVINWSGDVRHPVPNWYVEIGRLIQLTLFTNMNDVNYLNRFGANADYMQIAIEENFKPTGIKREEAEIIFMGNNVGGFPLSRYRIDMVNFLRGAYGNRFKCYGVNWPHYSHEPQQLEESKIYRGAKIGINLSHFNYERYTSDRLLRIMGSGCFCLSHNYPGIEKEFEIGKHLDVWNDLTELKAKIDLYLKDNDLRNKIAAAGSKHVHQNHTWDKRFEELSQKLKNPN